MGRLVRATEAGKILGVGPQTVRNWSNSGKLPHTRSAANQRLYDINILEEYKNKQLGIETKTTSEKIFYTRSSSHNDILVETQHNKLVYQYGQPDYSFTDVSSGLNDNRTGLNKLIKHLKNTDSHCVVYITNKDRLTRFGYKYLEDMFSLLNTEIVVLDSDETKEPLEVLMQDFMSLLASFSGKFYRLRGWEQRKQFLKDVEEEVDKHVKE